MATKTVNSEYDVIDRQCRKSIKWPLLLKGRRKMNWSGIIPYIAKISLFNWKIFILIKFVIQSKIIRLITNPFSFLYCFWKWTDLFWWKFIISISQKLEHQNWYSLVPKLFWCFNQNRVKKVSNRPLMLKDERYLSSIPNSILMWKTIWNINEVIWFVKSHLFQVYLENMFCCIGSQKE